MSTDNKILKIQNERAELSRQNKNARIYILRNKRKIEHLQKQIALEQFANMEYGRQILENTEKFHQLGTELETITNTKRINSLQ